MVWIPTVDYILSLFRSNINKPNLINSNGLTGTLDKVEYGLPYREKPSIWSQVTILYKEIVENHYFFDGNKRIGSLIAYIFLFKNGFKFSPNKGEIYDITIATAQGLKSTEELKIWFKVNSIKI